MLALTISKVRPFMAALLTKDSFDSFLLREGSVTTFCTYTIDGTYQSAFFGDDETSEEAADPPYASWAQLRPHVFDMIKGSRTPLAFRLVFHFPKSLCLALTERSGYRTNADNLNAFFLNLRFKDNLILLTTGSSQTAFPPDRELDRIWDTYIRSFLTRNGLEFEEA